MLSPLCRLIVSALLVALGASAAAADTLWLSDTPPGDSRRGTNSHGGRVEIRRGIFHKHLWLRLGSGPHERGYVKQGNRFAALTLIDAKGKVSRQEFGVDKEHGLLDVTFPMPDEGFYNIYVSRQQVNNNERRFEIAKSEVLKHSCREGHDNVQEKMPPRHNPAVALEIVRERRPKEDFHSRACFGDTISFIVMRNGTPLPGAEVSLSTALGWSKRALSDERGRVSYTMIRDYFPPWRLFNKRYAQSYLVKAEYRQKESGELEGQAYDQTLYCTSYAGSYYPSRSDYQSYGYGLVIGLFMLVFSGLAVYFYRRRRVRPFREVCFDE
jgi:hypothetical protein